MAAPSANAAVDPAGAEFFETKIRPLLADNCYSCHSQEAKKIKGGLLLDTREGLLKGGDTGPGIVPGDADKSLLIKAVRYTDENLQMPPKGKKLSAEKIAALEQWVKMGAPDPRESKPGTPAPETIREKARSHWAFQPLREPAIPPVKNKRLSRTPVDNFILAKLEEKGIRPLPEADKRTLIRRATFDLTGLPPQPGEVEAFLADKSANAFDKVVDRLLESPHYGERWGRHWLDVARYADTKGYVFEEDRHYPYSYTYRDYVIRSFNEDLPYDEFLKEQIAADLLPLGKDKRALAALGFLTLGRRFVNNINDIIDDRIDVVCRGTMGLTVTCARCHDHKYDPIPTRDYYSLYGIFSSSMEPEEEPLLGIVPPAKALAEYETEHQKRVKEHDDFERGKQDETLAMLRHQSGDYLLTASEAAHQKDDGKVDILAKARKLDPGIVRRWMTGIKEWSTATNAIFAPWLAYSSLATNEFAPKSRDLAQKFAANADSRVKLNPLVAKIFAADPPSSLKEVADRYGKMFTDLDAEWQKLAVSTNAPKFFADGDKEALRQVLYAANAPANPPRQDLDRIFDVASIQKVRELKRAIDALDATSPGAPPRATALVDRPDPGDVGVFIRGNPDNRGAKTPRQFLELIAGANRTPFRQGSGRLQLAEAIGSKDNPLTARVLVNRVWLHHFGTPLVATPSDFGLRSDPPTHPELLDYLASRFMADGWSIKKLHRLIMLSAAYRRSSDDNPQCEKLDPANQLYWRMNRQRLDFEATRDTLLSVAGDLNTNMGGHAVDITEAPYSTRRTVYGFVDRQNLPNLFRAFDFASPDTSSARRFYTTVPQQALYMMNSPFVVEQAEKLAGRPEIKSAATEKSKVRAFYELAYQREPTADELDLARRYFEKASHVPEPAGATNWVLGYGGYDESSKRVKSFAPLPYYTGLAFQGGSSLPDPKLGWVTLNADGGHPGNDIQHAAIRRWIAPRDGVIAINGTLSHHEKHGDGVRGRIVSSRLGPLGEWLAHNQKRETKVENVRVSRGDTVDFVTDCYGTVDYDSFGWAPEIRFQADDKTRPGERMEWNAQKDYAETARVMHPAMDAWQKYAQVVLLANELVFVD